MKKTWCKSGLIAVAATCLLLTGCASTQSGGAQEELRTSSDETDAQKRAQIRLQLAVGYYQQGQLSVALDELKQALQIDPNFSDAYGVRALIYMDMGENRLADDNFLKAIKLAPKNPDLTNNYGWFLCQSGRESQSIPYFEAAIQNKYYQSPSKALNNAGVCSLKLKDMVAAERYFVQAFQYDPGNLDTSANLAKVYYGRGDYQRARFYSSRVIKENKFSADILWTAIKIERKLGDRQAENSLFTQLRRRYPTSPELAAYTRGAFDE